jgi:hypothetical protein
VNDLKEEMIAEFKDKDLYEKATPHYLPDFEGKWGWRKGELNILFGPGNHGKSEIANCLILLKSINDGDVWAYWSPENIPAKDFFNNIIHMLIGKSTDPNFNTLQMSMKEYLRGIDWANKHIYNVYPEEGESHDYQTLTDKFKAMIIKYNITGIVMDPLNQLDRTGDDARAADHRYLSNLFSHVGRFIKLHGLYSLLVTHGDVQYNPDSRVILKPNMYRDIEGGKMASKKADNILYYYRPNFLIDISDPLCVLGSQKIKKRKLTAPDGPGEAEYTFEKTSNRFFTMTGKDVFTGQVNQQVQNELQFSNTDTQEVEEQLGEGNWTKLPPMRIQTDENEDVPF